jgi:hypothetical protein
MRELLLKFECRPAVGGYHFVSFDPSKFEDHHFLGDSVSSDQKELPEDATDDERYLLSRLGTYVRIHGAHSALTTYLVPNTQQTKRFDLFSADPQAFLKLARLSITPEAAVTFANRFGPLIDGTLVESFYDWAVAVKEMRKGVSAWEHAQQTGNYAKLSRLFGERPISEWKLDVLLANVKSGAPQISLKPPVLIGALEVQFGLAITGDHQLGTCVECGGWFSIPANRGRSDKKYCSDACRMRACRKRKGRH